MQAAVSGRGGREFPDPQQPSDGVERSRDVHVRVGVHAAGDGAYFSASLYDGHSHPFSEVEGMARTRWPSDL